MKLSIILLTAITLFSCNMEKIAPDIKINFVNETQRDIQNVSVNGVNLGTIKNRNETGLIKFDNFGTDTGMPDCDFISVFQNDTIKSTSEFFWCGTEKTGLKPGNYKIIVKLDTVRVDSITNKKYFRLEFK